MSFQQAFNVILMGLVLGTVGSCGGGSSGDDGPPPMTGFDDPEHMRPRLREGFSTAITPNQRSNHALYSSPAANGPAVVGERAAEISSLTQGSRGDEGITNDRVYMTFRNNQPSEVHIDIGNDGIDTPDLADVGNLPRPIFPSEGQGGIMRPAQAFGRFAQRAAAEGGLGQTNILGIVRGRDRRLDLGEEENNLDPHWYYTSRNFLRDGDGAVLGGNLDLEGVGDFLIHIVDWSSGFDEGGYLGGGIWMYHYENPENRNQPLTAVGVFIDGENPVGSFDVTSARGTATYRGHSFGRYTVLPAPLRGDSVEPNVGYFAAKATLDADFTRDTATVFGTITNFLFNTNLFDATGRSALEQHFGGEDGIRIALARANVVGNRFVGATRSERLMVGPRGSQSDLILRGDWSGRFYGRPPARGDVPWLIGGTWGATGQSADPGDNGFGFSLTGVFATEFDRVMEISSTLVFQGTPNPYHDRYDAATANFPLFADGETPGVASSVTQGSLRLDELLNPSDTNPTNDRVYLNLSLSSVVPRTGLRIDVGNDGSGRGAVADIASTFSEATRTPAPLDRRGGTTLGSGSAEDPRWTYATQVFQNGDGNDAAGELEASFVEWSSETGNYVSGGIWTRAYDSDVEGPQTVLAIAVGAFVDGEDPVAGRAVHAATGTATYHGHSYGHYSLAEGIVGESGLDNPGFFAAKARLNVDFGSGADPGTVSGTISDFLFSKDNTFRQEQTSDLEAAIGGRGKLIVYLRETSVSNNNTFSGLAESNGIRQGISGSLDLLGRWGGRFYGTPEDTGNAPQVIAGTWGVDDATTNNLALSLVGSFGAGLRPGGYDRFISLPILFASGTNRDNPIHSEYIRAARAAALFADGATTASSITQGSSRIDHDDNEDTRMRTNDRTYLGIFRGAVIANTGLSIDVGRDGSRILTSDGRSTSITNLQATNRRDRRTSGRLGSTGDSSDPNWNYTTHMFQKGSQNDSTDEFEAVLVDWSSDTNNYMSGGVWTRVYDADGDGPGTALATAIGAFVDGQNPTETDEVGAARGTATYRGHSYGHYSFSNGFLHSSEVNPGRFSAKARLNADFDANSGRGTVSGSISSFLFSEGDAFTEAEKSRLEDSIGGPSGLLVTLEEANISADANEFGGRARGSGIRISSVDGARFNLTGQWDGRFYGTPPRAGDAPQAAGGTWGVGRFIPEDVAVSPGLSFYLLGSFGTRLEE